jgi:histidine ammonia-lyase
MTVLLDSLSDFTLDNCRRVAWANEPVSIGETAKRKMAESRERFLRLIEDPSLVIYGVTSGYGQNASKRLTPEERKAHARRPPTPAATSWGDDLPERVTRAIVFARLANFIDGHAAVSPSLAMAVAGMLDGRPLPKVPARGQGGAGEILSLSHLFLELAQTHEIGEKDVLSLINGSPSAAALVADGALAAKQRLDVAVEVLALAAESFNAPITHFAQELEALWNNPHDAWALRSLRQAIGLDDRDRRPYQAPVSFRILPRILGQARRAALTAEQVASESLAAVTDNPVILPPAPNRPFGEAISTGGYHNSHVPPALDALTAAYANLCIVAERLAAKLLDGAVSLLPPQLDPERDGQYLGCLPMAIVGYEEEARMLAQATLLPGSESGGFGQNDVASPIFLAWSKQERAGELLECSLAALAPVAQRARSPAKRLQRHYSISRRRLRGVLQPTWSLQPWQRKARRWRNCFVCESMPPNFVPAAAVPDWACSRAR